MSQKRVGRAGIAVAVALLCTAVPQLCLAAPNDVGPAAATPPAPSGVWRGTSTCTDRMAAPACHDEVVVYEFTTGAKPGTVHWKADKIVDGQREPMGELDLVYDAGEACWRAEFRSPQIHSIWCLAVDGARMTGTARLLPGNKIVRRIDVRKD